MPSPRVRGAMFLFGIGYLFVCGYFFWQECSFQVYGSIAEATVTKVEERTNVRFGGRIRRTTYLTYSFDEPNGTHGTGGEEVPQDYPHTQGQRVMVLYTTGILGSSRINSGFNYVWILLFVAGVVGLAIAASLGAIEGIAVPFSRPKKSKKVRRWQRRAADPRNSE